VLRRALAIVTVILACVAAGVLAASAALDHAALDSGALSRLPACSARLAGSSCGLCGMSHSLVAISDGDLREAVRWNAAGPWVYGALALQAAAGVAVGVVWGRRRRGRRE
jgi:hypothetical protein